MLPCEGWGEGSLLQLRLTVSHVRQRKTLPESERDSWSLPCLARGPLPGACCLPASVLTPEGFDRCAHHHVREALTHTKQTSRRLRLESRARRAFSRSASRLVRQPFGILSDRLYTDGREMARSHRPSGCSSGSALRAAEARRGRQEPNGGILHLFFLCFK